MGRKKIYDTDDDKQKAKQKDNKLYYERHKEKIKRKRMEDYWRRKKMGKIVSDM